MELQSYGIIVTPLLETTPTVTRAKNFDWSKETPADHLAVETKLRAYLENVGRIQEIANHKDMRMIGNEDGFKTGAINADAYLKSALAYDATLAAKK